MLRKRPANPPIQRHDVQPPTIHPVTNSEPADAIPSQHSDWEVLAMRAKFRPAHMACLCGLTVRQLERIFAARLGKSPIACVRQLRCRLAVDLISKGWKNKAVVDELGFSDESHLCHEFEHFYGKPPQSFAPFWKLKFPSSDPANVAPIQ